MSIAAEGIVTDSIETFGRGDYDRMGSLLAVDVQSYVTNAAGGVTLVDGRDAHMNGIESIEYKAVGPSVAITQILMVKSGQVMAMVEIKAERKGRSLHNFAAFPMDVADGWIHAMCIVEALPAYSDEFWRA